MIRLFNYSIRKLLKNICSQGEVCSNASKVLVHISCYDEFREKVVKQTENLVIGDPLLKETKIGATISREHLNKVKAYIDEAVQQVIWFASIIASTF